MAFLRVVAFLAALLPLAAADSDEVGSTCDQSVQTSALLQARASETKTTNVQHDNQWGVDNDACTSRHFFDYPHACETSRHLPDDVDGRRDRGPYVTCRHTGDDTPHEENSKEVCTTWHDDRCGVHLKDDWCCDTVELDGGEEKKWKFLKDEFEQAAKVTRDGQCIGCHYKYGGNMDEEGNEYNKNQRADKDDAMLGFRCRDIGGSKDSEKFEKIAYLRPWNSNMYDAPATMVAKLNVRKND